MSHLPKWVYIDVAIIAREPTDLLPSLTRQLNIPLERMPLGTRWTHCPLVTESVNISTVTTSRQGVRGIIALRRYISNATLVRQTEFLPRTGCTHSRLDSPTVAVVNEDRSLPRQHIVRVLRDLSLPAFSQVKWYSAVR